MNEVNLPSSSPSSNYSDHKKESSKNLTLESQTNETNKVACEIGLISIDKENVPITQTKVKIPSPRPEQTKNNVTQKKFAESILKLFTNRSSNSLEAKVSSFAIKGSEFAKYFGISDTGNHKTSVDREIDELRDSLKTFKDLTMPGKESKLSDLSVEVGNLYKTLTQGSNLTQLELGQKTKEYTKKNDDLNKFKEEIRDLKSREITLQKELASLERTQAKERSGFFQNMKAFNDVISTAKRSLGFVTLENTKELKALKNEMKHLKNIHQNECLLHGVIPAKNYDIRTPAEDKKYIFAVTDKNSENYRKNFESLKLKNFDIEIEALQLAIDEMTIYETITVLPEDENKVPMEFKQIPVETFAKIQKSNSLAEPKLSAIKDGTDRFGQILGELDRLKDRLGGSPVFKEEKPTMHDRDQGKYFFGVPMGQVKDWFRMTLDNKWSPRFFWKGVASLFDVSATTKKSQYEEAYVRIQRFGMVLENKDRLFEILNNSDNNRYHEMHDIAGMIWHVGENSPGLEKMNIELVENFLTEHFENAKSQGDDALIQFFNAFKGVCFEDRCRNILAYIEAHPTKEAAAVMQELKNITDFNTDVPADYREIGEEKRGAFYAELEAITPTDPYADLPTPNQFREWLKNKGIFDIEFQESPEKKEKPSLEKFHNFAIAQTKDYLLENYSHKDFLNMELEIFRASGKNSVDEFKEQLQKRINDFGSIDLDDDTTFSIESDETKEFILEAFK